MAFPLLFSGFLLSMQAAGMIVDYKNTQSNQRLIQKGRDLEKAALETNLEAIQAESGQQSLEEMRQLRQNLGTQIAQNAARGISSSSPQAFGKMQQSIGAFNEDEKTRRLNLLAKESGLRAQNVLSGLHTTQSETQLGQAMTSRFIQSIPVSGIFSALTNQGKKKGASYGLEDYA